MEDEKVNVRQSYIQWLKETKNWVISALLSIGELSSHIQQGLIYNLIEFTAVFFLVSITSYKFGWFWNWFSK